MPLGKETLEHLIMQAFPDADIVISDLAGDNDHWSVHIASNQFEGKNRIAQHKMVYAALQGKMGTELHAMQLKTSTKAS